MKTISLVTILLITAVSAQSQPSDTTSLEEKAQNKISNYNFLQQTLTYSPLSHASPPGCDRGSPKGWYILSADIIPQFVLGGAWTRFTAHLTARYKVRIMRNSSAAGDSSLPVRTPSFMPGATVFYPLKRIETGDLRIKYLSLSFFHHSNGQDGNEFNSDGTINTYNGNFSTNYLEPAFHIRWRYNDDAKQRRDNREKNRFVCDDGTTGYRELYVRSGIEIYINTVEELRSSYGNVRLNLTGGYLWVSKYCDFATETKDGKRIKKQIGDSYLRETFRVVSNVTYIGGSRDRGLSDLAHRINADIQGYYRIPSSPNTSLFIGIGYVGSDTYNIYYEDNYFNVRAGIALGFFVAPAIVGSKRPDKVSSKYVEE
jgi:hypothetical protein